MKHPTKDDLIIFSTEDGEPWAAFVWGEADPIPFADGSTARLRAGDTIYHTLAQEEWMVLADTGRMIAWAGYPPGMENRANLTPRHRCSDAEHLRTMADVRKGSHPLRDIILRENGALH